MIKSVKLVLKADPKRLQIELKTRLCPVMISITPPIIRKTDTIMPIISTKKVNQARDEAALIFSRNMALSTFLAPTFMVAEYMVLHISHLGI